MHFQIQPYYEEIDFSRMILKLQGWCKFLTPKLMSCLTEASGLLGLSAIQLRYFYILSKHTML